MADLSEYSGIFASGFTEQDLASVLPRLSHDLGLTIVGVWEYLDEWGPGGSSSLAVERDGDAFTLPRGLHELLMDGEGSSEIDPSAGSDQPHPDIVLRSCMDWAAPQGHQYHYEMRHS